MDVDDANKDVPFISPDTPKELNDTCHTPLSGYYINNDLEQFYDVNDTEDALMEIAEFSNVNISGLSVFPIAFCKFVSHCFPHMCIYLCMY